MATSTPAPRTALSNAVMCAGGALVATGLFFDTLGLGRRPGVGPAQIAMAAAGAAIVFAGLWLSPARRQRWTSYWAATPAAPLLTCLTLGLCCGLLMGLVEVIHYTVRLHGFGLVTRQSQHFLWLATLSHIVLFGGLGAICGVLATIAPRVVRLPVVVTVMATVATYSQLVDYRVIEPGVTWFLSLCLGLHAGRTLGPSAALLSRGRAAIPKLLAVVAVISAAMVTWHWWRERSAVGSLPAAAAGAPSVVLVVLDTVRADHLGMYDYERPTTPFMDSLAADGIVFDRALATSPWTLPSHTAMFTGRFQFETNASWLVPLNDEHPTLAEAFAARGYLTAGFIGNKVYCARDYGLARGFQHYEDYHLKPAVFVASTAIGRRTLQVDHASRQSARFNDGGRVVDGFVEWLGAAEERPVFAFLNLVDAHALYRPPAPYDRAFGEPQDILDDWYTRSDWDDEQMQVFRDAYDGCLLYLDDLVKRIVDALRERGALENTVLVITSDHGEHFGEHGLTDHGNSLYDPLLHIPLVLHFPAGIDQPRRVPRPVSLRDLPATICDLTGLDIADFPGHSLRPLWQDPATAELDTPLLGELGQGINKPRHLPHASGALQCLYEGSLHLILDAKDIPHLYDLSRDPGELHDLAEERPDDVRRMRAKIEALVPADRR